MGYPSRQWHPRRQERGARDACERLWYNCTSRRGRHSRRQCWLGGRRKGLGGEASWSSRAQSLFVGARSCLTRHLTAVASPSHHDMVSNSLIVSLRKTTPSTPTTWSVREGLCFLKAVFQSLTPPSVGTRRRLQEASTLRMGTCATVDFLSLVVMDACSKTTRRLFTVAQFMRIWKARATPTVRLRATGVFLSTTRQG